MRPSGCVRCRDGKIELARCPYCGAELIAPEQQFTSGLARREPDPDRPPSPFEREEAELERRLLMIAPPAALLLALLLQLFDTWRSVARVFLTMWVHELGHAVAAWFSGFFAIPGPWFTRIYETRSALVILVLAAVIAWIGYRGYRREARWQVGLAGLLLLIQGVLTFGLRPGKAAQFITFFGDGGMFVLGAALMATFWSPPGSHLHRGWLRWGFLVIGAFAFCDAFLSWWGARGDPSTIPYGELEGIGQSDPTKLVFKWGWNQSDMIRRYLLVAGASFAALAVRYTIGILRPPPIDPNLPE